MNFKKYRAIIEHKIKSVAVAGSGFLLMIGSVSAENVSAIDWTGLLTDFLPIIEIAVVFGLIIYGITIIFGKKKGK